MKHFNLTTIKENKILTNSIGLFISKFGRAILSFVSIPLVLNVIDKSEYGIWLVIFSLFNWVFLIDIGITNGLRLKLLEAIASDDIIRARKLLSTSYIVLGIFLLFFFTIFVIISSIIDWNKLLNAPQSIKNFQLTITISFFLLILGFWVNIINQVFVAISKISYIDILLLIGEILIFLFFLIINISSIKISLLTTAIVFTASPVLVSTIATLFCYTGKYKYLSPKINLFEKKLIFDILQVGVRYFLIQFCGIILFQSQSIYITHEYGPSSVATFQIAYKYFSISSLILNTLTLPYFPEITILYKQNKYLQIIAITRRLFHFWGFSVFILLGLLLFSSFFLNFWLEKKIIIPFDLSFSIFLWLCFHFLCVVLFGILLSIEEIGLQVIIAILAIPFTYCILMILPTNLGVEKIPIANAIYLIFNSILMLFQLKTINTKLKKQCYVQ